VYRLVDLPYEILLYLLEYTSGKTVARVGMVNHTLCSVCQDDTLWKRFVIDEFGRSPYIRKLSGERTSRGDYLALFKLYQANRALGREFKEGMFCSPIIAQTHAPAFKKALSRCVVEVYKYTNLDQVTQIFDRILRAIDKYSSPNERSVNPIFHILAGSWLDLVEERYPQLVEMVTHIKRFLLRRNFVRTDQGWRDNNNEEWVWTGSWADFNKVSLNLFRRCSTHFSHHTYH